MRKLKLDNLTFKILDFINKCLLSSGIISILLFPNFTIYLFSLFVILGIILSYFITSDEYEKELQQKKLKKLNEKKSIEYYFNIFFSYLFGLICIVLLVNHFGDNWIDNYLPFETPTHLYPIFAILSVICFNNSKKFK